MSVDIELAYHERCRAIATAMGGRLWGSTRGDGFDMIVGLQSRAVISHAALEFMEQQAAEIRALRTENERMRGQMERVAKTADGVPIYVGMMVWTKQDVADPATPDFAGWPVTGIGHADSPEHVHYEWVQTGGIGQLTTQVIYSTPEAAKEASREER